MPAAVVKSFAQKSGKTVSAVEKLWQKAKAAAAKAGRKEDYAYIVGILKRMLRIESQAEGEESPSDLALLLEVWGPEVSARLLTEAMPASVKANVAMRWLEIEKQIRNIPNGNVNWPTLARSLRQAVYTLLSWAAQDRAEERYKKHVGIV